MKQQLIERVKSEIAVLAHEIGGLGPSSDRVKIGGVVIGTQRYLGVIIENLGVNPRCFFGTKSVRALLLLPPVYPRVPPLGIYVNRRHRVTSTHFIGRSTYGVPDLVNQGWYWFCHGVGSLDQPHLQALWRPAANPADGHNLATVVAAARVAMNAGD